MFTDKLKNFFARSSNNNEEENFFDRAVNMINSHRRTTIENPIAEFEDYLHALPSSDLQKIKNHKPKPRKIATLRPQLVSKCYKNVPRHFFDKNYAVNEQMFTRNRKEVSQKTSRMSEYLDEVDICLFNQISSRFDEILAVLRTIESLECVVVYNSKRLRQVRANNITIAKNVSERHLRIVKLLKRQERLKNVIDKLAELKIYTGLVGQQMSQSTLHRQSSQRYEQINQIRIRRELYFQLQSTKHFEQRIQSIQSQLKKGYTDSINDAFFKYAVEILPYDSNFWEKKFIGRVIFEAQEADADGTVILDESMLMEQEVPDNLRVRLVEGKEKDIVDNVLKGWRDGQYSTGSIKAAFDRLVKEKHHRFLSQCRNYCFQNYIKQDRKKIENPNLANLMQQMNIFFCTKTFTYYGDMYRTMLARCFSLVGRVINAIVEQSRQELTLEEKEKITLLVDGFFSIISFVFKIVFEKVVEAVQLKRIYDSMQLQDFRQLMNILEAQEEFINKHLTRHLTITAEGSFLQPIIANCVDKFDFDSIRKVKQEKILSFLNRTHRYIIQNQLRDSFENQVWKPTDIPTFYYDSLHYLITGESLNLRRNRNMSIRHNVSNLETSVWIDRLGKEASVMIDQKLIGNFRIIRSQIIIDNKVYKVTQTLLLLLEIVQDYLHIAQFYPFSKQEVGLKIFELLRAYNTLSHQLIVMGGAVKLQKIKTKNITAKHLALNSLCLSFLLYIMKCIKERVPVHDEEKIRKDLEVHQESIIKKLASILSGKVNQGLGDINLGNVPTKGTQAMVNSTKILHDILVDFYQKEVLSHIFVKNNIELYLNKLRGLEITSRMQAQSLKDDMNFYFHQLAFLDRLIDDFQKLRLDGQEIVRIKFQDL